MEVVFDFHSTNIFSKQLPKSMHIEVYIARVRYIQTGEEQEILLCFEVGETEEDRKKLIQDFQSELHLSVNNEPYRLLGYVSHKIYPKDD